MLAYILFISTKMGIMAAKSKKWESGPNQNFKDDRTQEQSDRAKEEVERNNKNLEGSYKEKNGGKNKQFSDLKNEPKEKSTGTDPEDN